MHKPIAIRLRKKSKQPPITYDLVVMYKDKRQAGDYLEKIGFFSPTGADAYWFMDSQRLVF